LFHTGIGVEQQQEWQLARYERLQPLAEMLTDLPMFCAVRERRRDFGAAPFEQIFAIWSIAQPVRATEAS
jgi:hypothetical protein